MTRTLGLIGAPSSAGAYAPGQEKAPATFRRHGLVSALAGSGRRVNDRGNIPGFRWRLDPQRPKAMNLDAVRRTAAAVAEKVEEALVNGEAALVLGGDCTVELGTVAGALRDGHSVGLVYIDLDADLNTPETSDGALDWTGVAHLLDLPGAEAELSGLGPRRPMLAPADILYLRRRQHHSRRGGRLSARSIWSGSRSRRSKPIRSARPDARWLGAHATTGFSSISTSMC